MSILESSPSPQTPAVDSELRRDRFRVITAGQVGNLEARLGASGFDVVSVAETENALIDAVSADEPDAIVVESDLCDSLEHVRGLAPDAVLIAVGDHTPVGAHGRIERGVSGTVMAGLLHALVADGFGAAAAWGLVPAFGPDSGLHLSQGVGGWLLSAKADFLRASLVNAFRDHADLVAAAGTLAVTVSASLVLTLSAARTDERPARVPVTPPTLEPAPPHPIAAASPFVDATHYDAGTGPWPRWGGAEAGNLSGPNRGESRSHGPRHRQRSEASLPPGVAHGWDHRPPKHADNGHHKGWTNNSVPEDLPPGQNSLPGDHPPGKGGRGQASGRPCGAADGGNTHSTRTKGHCGSSVEGAHLRPESSGPSAQP